MSIDLTSNVVQMEMARVAAGGAPMFKVPPLQTVSAASFAGKPIPERPFLVAGLIPAGIVGGIYGDGAGGKSLLALMLAVSVVTGRSFIGYPVNQTGPVIVLACEDDIDEIHRRVVSICHQMDVPLTDLADLHIVSLVDDDATLAKADRGESVITTTPLYQQMAELCDRIKPALVVLDTLADTFAGDENSRQLAKQFVKAVRRLVVPSGGTGLIIAHPSLGGMQSGRGTSGSTGWSNSLRWRGYLERVYADDGVTEPDDKLRVFSTKKSNYGATGGELRLRWENGCFRPENLQSNADPLTQASHEERVFLTMLEKYAADGRTVSATKSANYAPAVFAKDAMAGGLRKAVLEATMNRLFARDRIRVETIGPPSRQRQSLVAVPLLPPLPSGGPALPPPPVC